jgi:hypothetical protein
MANKSLNGKNGRKIKRMMLISEQKLNKPICETNIEINEFKKKKKIELK